MADVQPAPSHMATAEGDEREAAMTVGRQAVAALCDTALIFIFSVLLINPLSSKLPNTLYKCPI